MGLHRCTFAECPFVGRQTSRGCNCHKSDEQVLSEVASKMLAALIAISRNAALDDAWLDPVRTAIAAARAAGIEPKE